MMVLGYGLTHFRLLDVAILPLLRKLLFNFAIPILLFRSIATAKMGDIQVASILASYYIPVFLLYLLALLIATKLLKLTLFEAAIIAMGCCFSNNLLVAFPILDAIWGDKTHGTFFTILSVHAAILWSLSIITINISQQKSMSVTHFFKEIMSKTILNPIVFALLIGLVWRLIFGNGLPMILDGFMKMIAQMALPLALIMLGVQIYEISKEDQPEKLSHSGFIIFSKLILLPALVFIFAQYIFDLDAKNVAILTLIAISPVGVNAYLLALNYGSQIRKMALSIFLSTALSLGVFMMAIQYFQDFI